MDTQPAILTAKRDGEDNVSDRIVHLHPDAVKLLRLDSDASCKVNAQILHFRVDDTDVRIYIDISGVGHPLPVRITVDSGGPVRVTFPPFADHTNYLKTFPDPSPPSASPGETEKSG